MSKASPAIATTPSSDNPARNAADLISQLINARPQSPSIAEIEAIISATVPVAIPTVFSSVEDWRRRAAENKAAWQALGPNPADEDAEHVDDELQAHAHQLMMRPVKTWEDVAVLGDLAMYWIYGGDVVFGESLRHDLQERTEGYDVQVIAHLLNGIARLTGGRHV